MYSSNNKTNKSARTQGGIVRCHLCHEVCVAVGGHHGVVGALALAEVGLVLLGVDDPVPAVVLLEVDGVVPQAAVGLVHVGLLSAHLGGKQTDLCCGLRRSLCCVLMLM